MHQFEPFNSQLWQCRQDAIPGEFFCHNISGRDLTSDQLNPGDFALLGFASDLGVQKNLGRLGAKLAPNLIRQFLARLAIPYLRPGYDYGNIVVDNNASLLDGQSMLAAAVSRIVSAQLIPLVLGGGHETAYGHYLGLMNALDEDIAILNFDAHFDLRPVGANNEGNSGTPFRQIYNLCQQRGRKFNYYCIGIQPRANTHTLYEFARHSQTKFIEASVITRSPSAVSAMLGEILANHRRIYVTICLDVFHYSYAPGVSAPQPFGINPQVVVDALHYLAPSNQVVGLDIVELNPLFDIDNHTARLAANLISEFYYGVKR